MHQAQAQRRLGHEERGRSRQPFGNPNVRGASNPGQRVAARVRRSSAPRQSGAVLASDRRRSTSSNRVASRVRPRREAPSGVRVHRHAGGDAREHRRHPIEVAPDLLFDPGCGRGPVRRRISRARIAAPPSAARDASSTPPPSRRRGLTCRSRSLTDRGKDTEAAEYRKGYNQMVDATSARSESVPQTWRIHRRRELAADRRPVHCRRHSEAAACRPGRRGDFLVVLLLGADVED